MPVYIEALLSSLLSEKVKLFSFLSVKKLSVDR